MGFQCGVRGSRAGHNLLGAVSLALINNRDISQGVYISGMHIPLAITRSGGNHYVGMRQQAAQLLGTAPADLVSAAVGLTQVDLHLNISSSNKNTINTTNTIDIIDFY